MSFLANLYANKKCHLFGTTATTESHSDRGLSKNVLSLISIKCLTNKSLLITNTRI